MENNTPRPMDMAGDDLLCDELQNKSLKRRNLMTTDKQQPPKPYPGLKSLDRLAGTWKVSGVGRQSSRWHKAYFCIVW
jgi:hypothetical protein